MKLGIIYMAAGNSRRFGSNKLLYQLDGKELYRHGLDRLMDVVCSGTLRGREPRIENQIPVDGQCTASAEEPQKEITMRMQIAVPAEAAAEIRVFVVSQYPEILEQRIKYGIHQITGYSVQQENAAVPVYGVPKICAVSSPDSVKGISYTIRAGLHAVLEQLPDCDGVLFFTADQPLLQKNTIERFLTVIQREEPELASICFEEQPGSPTYFSGKYFDELLQLEGDIGGRRILKKYPDKIRYVEASDASELYDVDKMSEILAISR